LIEGVGGLRILNDVGVEVRKLKGLKLHAKMLLADGERAIIGSINLAPGSFDSRRELAIEVDDKHIVDRLHDVVKRMTGSTLTRLTSRTKGCWRT
jgi:cardiolipin synthase